MAGPDGVIDLRSDTVTRPSAAVAGAMTAAEVGDDVLGDDPTVAALEGEVAGLAGKQAGLFVPTGTQSNLTAILAHCQRGDEYIAGQNAHCYRWEAGGAAVLGSVQPQPVAMRPDGTMDLGDLAAAIKRQPSLHHFAHTRLMCLENTHDGHPLPSDWVTSACDVAREHDLALHLDGARLWHAAVADETTLADLAAPFDTVSLCLSKGLGAPAGSVLVGSTPLIEEARRWRKMLGGAMRQSGVLAAAGRHVVTHHRERLADDHRRATVLADGLAEILSISVSTPQTNMVFVDLGDHDPTLFVEAMGRAGVRLLGGLSPTIRLVTHLDVDDADVERTIEAAAAALG